MTVPTNYPVLSRIRQAVIYGIENRITEGGNAIRYRDGNEDIVSTEGYFTTFKHAYDPPKNIDQINEFPSCNVLTDNDFSNNFEDLTIGQNQGKAHNNFSLLLSCISSDINDPALVQDKMLHDIQKYFGINYYIPDQTGAQTCFDCNYESSTRWSTEDNEPRTGIDIIIKVRYRYRLTDPTLGG